VIDYRTPRWFPGLERVEPASERKRVWSTAYAPMLKNPAYWLIAAATQIAAQLVVVVPASRLMRSYGLYRSFVGWPLSAAAAALGCYVIVWLVRRRITRNLRMELTRRGLPTCLGCGYDLTGNVSGVCPECGKSASALGAPRRETRYEQD